MAARSPPTSPSSPRRPTPARRRQPLRLRVLDTAPAFAAPSPGGPIGGTLTARPEDVESAEGATAFSQWALSVLLNTPRSEEGVALWKEAGPGCDPCQKTAQVWLDQRAAGQEFRYASPPTYAGIAVKAQQQGDTWFVQHEVKVPVSTLKEGSKVLQQVVGSTLNYTFDLVWTDDAWRIQEFHVLG